MGDLKLVDECLRGNDQAWSRLLDKYKSLVYSISIGYGATSEDAADIFQAVCLELFTALPRLRNTESLRGWLVKVTAHMAFHWKRGLIRQSRREVRGLDEESLPPLPAGRDLEREQLLREAVRRLPRRDRDMIEMLYFEDPVRPYTEVAHRLGLSTGSIGSMRIRCLQRLRRILQELEVVRWSDGFAVASRTRAAPRGRREKGS